MTRQRFFGSILTALAAALFAPTLLAQGFIDLSEHFPDGRVRPIVRPAWPRPQWQPIRMQKHAVKTVIDQGVAKTTVTQVFSNPNQVTLEGTYVFPVSEEASITEFTMVMNGKTVKGEVIEREKARQIYEDIVRRVQDPALLEWVDKRLFRASVFPITPQSPVEITLTYVEQLKSEGGVYEYRYPLKTETFSKMPVDAVSLHATIASAGEIKSVFSSSHQIDKVVKDDHNVAVSFEGKSIEATKDFHLFYTVADGAFGLHLISDYSTVDGGTFLMSLAPRQDFGKEDIAPKDVIFVIDTSGSMREDQKMAQALAAIRYGLKSLRTGDRFNLVAFSTEARPYAEKLIEVNDQSIAEGLAWVEALDANGGTAIYDALNSALKSLPASSDRMAMVVFMTDGMPTIGEQRPEKILGMVGTDCPKYARIFVWGVGYDVNTVLLDSIAENSRGARDYVTPSQNIEMAMSRFFDRITYPVLSDLSIVVDGMKIEDVYPRALPDLFKGGQLTVVGRYTGGGVKAIRLRGKIGQKEKEFVYEARFAEAKTDRDFIAVLWARRKVGYLHDQWRLNGQPKEVYEEIVRLGKKYGIATPFTSFLVTEGDGATAFRRGAVPGGGGFTPNRPTGSVSTPPPGTGAPSPRKRGDSVAEGGADVVDRLSIPEFDAGEVNDVFATTYVDGKNPYAQPGTSFGLTEEEEARTNLFTMSTGGQGLSGANGAAGGKVAGEDAVKESIETKKLKDSELGDVTKESAAGRRAAIRRIGEQTYVRRGGVWVDERHAAKAKAELEKARLVESFSATYFELLKANPDLAKVLAAFPSCIVEIKGELIWIRPAAPAESRPAEVPAESRPTEPVK